MAHDLSDAAAVALCGIAVKGLISQGVDPVLATAFGERACRPVARKGIKKAGKVVKGKATKWNRHVKKEWAAYKKKHPNGKRSFASIVKSAKRSYKA